MISTEAEKLRFERAIPNEAWWLPNTLSHCQGTNQNSQRNIAIPPLRMSPSTPAGF